MNADDQKWVEIEMGSLYDKLYREHEKVKCLEAELDKLRKDYREFDTGLQKGMDELRAERDRLRAALERIAGLGNWYSCEIAREALAGKP